MARAKSIGIRETLTSLLPSGDLDWLALESGMVRRRRKVDPAAMLWTLVLGFGAGGERSLAGLRRTYQRATGQSLVPSAFYDRFTPQLVRFLRRVVEMLCRRLSEHVPEHSGLLARFSDVVVADATVVKLHRLLARRYAGTRTNSASYGDTLLNSIERHRGFPSAGGGNQVRCRRPLAVIRCARLDSTHPRPRGAVVVCRAPSPTALHADRRPAACEAPDPTGHVESAR